MNNSQTSTSGGASVDGNISTGGGIFVGRDHINNNFYEAPTAEDSWSNLNLRDYEPPPFDFKETATYLNQLRENRFLIICDPYGFDKQSLAFSLSRRLILEQIDLTVQLWNGNPERLDISKAFVGESALKSESHNCIFIVPNFAPRLLHDLSAVSRSLYQFQRNQYLIITSDTPLDRWGLNDATRKFGIELTRTHYDQKYLTEELYYCLYRVKPRLPKNFPIELFSTHLDATLLKHSQIIQQEDLCDLKAYLGFSLDDIAKLLSLPINIDLFVELLCVEQSEISPNIVKKIIDRIEKEKLNTKIEYLYNLLPSPREQLLATALFLFNNLWEGQFYAFLQETVDSVWPHIFEKVKLIDYYHLKELHSLFRYEDVPEEKNSYPGNSQVVNERKIVFRYPNQRNHLLRVIWNSQRRHLVEALRVLVIIIERSADQKVSQYEGYETIFKRRHLRTKLGEAISEIGLLSVQSIEHGLLRLASYSKSDVQAIAIHSVVANALADWYLKGEIAQRQLFNLLHRWQNGQWYTGIGTRINEDSVQLATARTIHYILLKEGKDSDERMPQPLFDLTWRLLSTSNYKVHIYFNYYIFKIVIGNYSIQVHENWPSLSNQFLLIAQTGGLRRSLVDLFAKKYQERPEDINIFLDSWHQTWLYEISSLTNVDIPKWIQALATIGALYSNLGMLEAFYEKWLLPLIGIVTPETNIQVVDILVGINESWKSTEQNPPQIEQMIFGWLAADPVQSNAHQVALLFFTAPNHKTVVKELAEQLGARRVRSTRRSISEWIAVQFAIPYRTKVRSILPFSLLLYERHPLMLRTIFDTWLNCGYKQIRKLTLSLRRTLWLIDKRNYFWVLFLCLLSISCLFFVLVMFP